MHWIPRIFAPCLAAALLSGCATTGSEPKDPWEGLNRNTFAFNDAVDRAVLAVDSPAVFALGGSMCEPATHRRWAQNVMRRAECFGIRHDPLAAVS